MFNDKPELKLLMQWLFEKADLTALGFSSAYDHKKAQYNDKQAQEKLFRLKPYKLRVFMPVVVEPVVNAHSGDVQLQEQRNLC